MTVPRSVINLVKSARGASRSVVAGLRSSAVILGYHRVSTPDIDPQALSVSPNNFADQIAWLDHVFEVISMSELIDALAEGHSVKRKAVISFDDGYRDNADAAASILSAREVPAIFYVVSSHVESQRAFWWDELGNLLLRPGKLPGRMNLRLHNLTFSRDLSSATAYSGDDFERHRSWNLLHGSTPTARHLLYRDLSELLTSMPTGAREDAMDSIFRWSLRDRDVASDEVMTPEQVSILAKLPGFEIGSHTSSHAYVSSLDQKDAATEWEGSKHSLERWAQTDIQHFSYPYGTRKSIPEEGGRKLEGLGYRSAVTTRNAFVGRGADPFQLPRMLVRDWDVETLRAQLGIR